MQVLVVVINEPKQVVPILDRFMEIGITGATVIDSTGMAGLIADHVPFFARFSRMDGEQHQSKTIFTVVRDELVQEAADSVDEIVGGLDNPNSGFLFALPVGLCRGLQPCRRWEQAD